MKISKNLSAGVFLLDIANFNIFRCKDLQKYKALIFFIQLEELVKKNNVNSLSTELVLDTYMDIGQ